VLLPDFAPSVFYWAHNPDSSDSDTSPNDIPYLDRLVHSSNMLQAARLYEFSALQLFFYRAVVLTTGMFVLHPLEFRLQMKGPSESASPIELKTAHIPELDALRGILSWWVVINHILSQSKYEFGKYDMWLRILVKGGYAVDIFMILSGFVISRLLREKRECYLPFITRRFFRIFPVLLFGLLLAMLARPFAWSIILDHWAPDASSDKWWASVLDNDRRYFGWHLLAHLTMLHGAIPDKILPGGTGALLVPAWSISLEWQYYLIAPLLMTVLARFRVLGGVLICVGSVFVLKFFGAQMLAVFPATGFLSQKFYLFVIGWISYITFSQLKGSHPDLPWQILFCITPLFGWVSRSMPLTIWIAILAIALADGKGRTVARLAWAKKILNHPWLQQLGKISYSTYLVHPSVNLVAGAVILYYLPKATSGGMALLLCVTAVPTTIIVSILSYRFIEAPFIRIGGKLARGIKDNRTSPFSRIRGVRQS
jgi:peptidoglycan/LPS O-acetylase OafA/YrhL